ncbi:hypothetical protein TNCV_3400821 [Trichonephila clavipes]|nr:hypothetical protein TNCV_3400821 [Trichonephila clavipes]
MGHFLKSRIYSDVTGLRSIVQPCLLFTTPVFLATLSFVPLFLSSVVASSFFLSRLSFDLLPGAGSCSLQPIHKTNYNRLQKKIKKFLDETWKTKLEAMNTQDNTLWQYQKCFRKKRSDIPSLKGAAITDEQKSNLLAPKPFRTTSPIM